MSHDVVLKKPMFEPAWFREQMFEPVVWHPALNGSRAVEYVHRLKEEIVEKRDGTYYEVTETKTISMKIEERKKKWYSLR